MNEKEIIRRIKQGEKALFETLVKEYYQEIYHSVSIRREMRRALMTAPRRRSSM